MFPVHDPGVAAVSASELAYESEPERKNLKLVPNVPDNGHSVCGVGYTPAGVTICTWGLLGLLTDAAIGAYASHGSRPAAAAASTP